MDLTKYYEDICKAPMLSREEEETLFKEYHNEETSEKRKRVIRDTIIGSSLRFVFKTARNKADGDLTLFEEFIMEGNEGLLVGFEKFDHTSGNRFLSYAGWWVLQRILKAMSKMRMVSLPIWKQQLVARIQKSIEEREETPSIEELMKEFPDSSEKEIRELSSTRYLTYYIDDFDEREFLHDPVSESIQQEIEDNLLKDRMMLLPSPYYEVLVMSYGLDDGVEKTPTHICKKLRITKEKFKELKKEALEMLQRAYEVT